MSMLRRLGLAAGLSTLLLAGGAQAQDSKTFNIWWFELPDSAEGVVWQKALDEFKASHPGVTVNFQQKTFIQLQKAGSMILNSNQAPDLLEYNKGNATAGLVASQGLLTPLDDTVKQRGWDKILNDTDLQLARYDENGVYGSGPIYGIPTYGEFVSVFYNKDMLDANGLKLPTTLDEFVADMDAFKQKGITPLAMGGKDTSAQHLLYTLALSKADDTWVHNFQGLKTQLDTAPLLYAAQTMQDWVNKGYISKDATGLMDPDAANVFTSGKAPIYVSGTWNLGAFASTIKTFKWGQFLLPTPKYSVGSTGNLWIVPKGAQSKDLAYDFIGLTLSPKYQTELANEGGVAIAADPSTITNPVGSTAAKLFTDISSKGGLGFYPDWPVPGFYDVLIQKTAGLIGGTLTPQQFVDQLKQSYDEAQQNQ
ncbi:MAG TPA: extracellular solute-binding protein [Devosiaceae bacterium]|nr:extracellular solute-binding protein [Devosiaceae bacterium]